MTVRALDRVIHAVATGYRDDTDVPRCVTPRMLGIRRCTDRAVAKSVVLRKRPQWLSKAWTPCQLGPGIVGAFGAHHEA